MSNNIEGWRKEFIDRKHSEWMKNAMENFKFDLEKEPIEGVVVSRDESKGEIMSIVNDIENISKKYSDFLEEIKCENKGFSFSYEVKNINFEIPNNVGYCRIFSAETIEELCEKINFLLDACGSNYFVIKELEMRDLKYICQILHWKKEEA